jgi:hypothetical protein
LIIIFANVQQIRGVSEMFNTAQIERLKTLLQPDVVAELGLLARGPVDLLQLLRISANLSGDSGAR